MAAQNAFKHGVQYPVICVEKSVCTKLNFAKGYPGNYIVDATGKIIFGNLGSAGFGHDAFKKEVIPFLDSLLAKPEGQIAK